MIEVKGEDITPNRDGGVLKQVLQAGTGDNERPLTGDSVVVHYHGTLLDGSKFDSSYDRGEKFKFEIGKGQVIKGWDLGIATMIRGEKSRFIIRSDYGYGDRGSGEKIPPKATLVFDVELFDFNGEDISKNSDNSLIKRILIAGEGYANPNEGATVECDLKGSTLDGRVFDERTSVKFEIGEGSKVNIIEGIEEALQKMKKNEHARVRIKSSLAWGKNGNDEFGIGPHVDVQYEILLKSFEKCKESWQMNGEEKLEYSELYKTKGTALFKEGKHALAIKKYKKIIDLLDNETYDKDDEKLKSIQLQVAANLNIAMCCLKLNSFRECLESCEKVLKHEAKNEKALFRMGQAYAGLNDFEAALKHYEQLLEVNSNSKEARQQIQITKEKMKESAKKEKQLYSKMFSYLGKSNGETSSNGEQTH